MWNMGVSWNIHLKLIDFPCYQAWMLSMLSHATVPPLSAKNLRLYAGHVLCRSAYDPEILTKKRWEQGSWREFMLKKHMKILATCHPGKKWQMIILKQAHAHNPKTTKWAIKKRALGCLEYIYDTHVYTVYDKPYKGSLWNNQDSMERKEACFFSWLTSPDSLQDAWNGSKWLR